MPLSILHLMSARRYVGEAARVLDLVEAQRALGLQVHLVLRRGYDVAEEAVRRKLSPTLAHFRSGFHPFCDMADIRQMRSLVREHHVDVVHVHRSKEHWLAALALRGRAQPALIRTRHVVMPIRNHAANRHLYARWTRGVVCVSGEVERVVKESLGAGLPRLRTIPGGLGPRTKPASSPEAVTAFREQMRIDRDAPVLVHLARIARVKGQDVVLEALPKVLAACPEAVCVFAYNRRVKAFLAELEGRAEALGIAAHIRFVDRLESIWPLLETASVSLVASRGSEGWSRVAVESLHAGTPLVATTVGSLPEIVRARETGRLIPPDAPGALAEAVIELLTDESARVRMAQAQRQAASAFTIEQTARTLLEFYRDSMAQEA